MMYRPYVPTTRSYGDNEYDDPSARNCPPCPCTHTRPTGVDGLSALVGLFLVGTLLSSIASGSSGSSYPSPRPSLPPRSNRLPAPRDVIWTEGKPLPSRKAPTVAPQSMGLLDELERMVPGEWPWLLLLGVAVSVAFALGVWLPTQWPDGKMVAPPATPTQAAPIMTAPILRR